MNKRKREKIRLAQAYISKATDLIEDVLEEERECLNNMPENLQYSDRYERMEAIVSDIEDGLLSIQSAEESFSNATL